MSNIYFSHYSVLKKECIDFLRTTHNDSSRNDLCFADLTFGAGGHTCEMLKTFPHSMVFATDQDPEAIENAKKVLANLSFEKRVELWHTNFENFTKIYKEKCDRPLNGILMDLGVSSHHFDSTDRGFSYKKDAILDMRMNLSDGFFTAEEIVNEYSQDELLKIIQEYGEDKFAYRIAQSIVEKRKQQRITTTSELEDIIFHAYPKNLRFSKTHPATRTFQALRIAVNRELEVLEKTIPDVFNLLSPGGVLMIISFHSLEDRIVKNSFKALEKNNFSCKIITKRPLVPSDSEVKENPRSRSAKLRVIQK